MSKKNKIKEQIDGILKNPNEYFGTDLAALIEQVQVNKQQRLINEIQIRISQESISDDKQAEYLRALKKFDNTGSIKKELLLLAYKNGTINQIRELKQEYKEVRRQKALMGCISEEEKEVIKENSRKKSFLLSLSEEEREMIYENSLNNQNPMVLASLIKECQKVSEMREFIIVIMQWSIKKLMLRVSQDASQERLVEKQLLKVLNLLNKGNAMHLIKCVSHVLETRSCWYLMEKILNQWEKSENKKIKVIKKALVPPQKNSETSGCDESNKAEPKSVLLKRMEENLIKSYEKLGKWLVEHQENQRLEKAANRRMQKDLDTGNTLDIMPDKKARMSL